MKPINRVLLGAVVLAAGLIPALMAAAAVGDLDASFGDSGILRITDESFFAMDGGMAALPDGGAVVVEAASIVGPIRSSDSVPKASWSTPFSTAVLARSGISG